MKRQMQLPSFSTESTTFPQLTSEQERALIERARAGEDVRDQIILSLQRRVQALATKYARPEEHEEFSDLVNSANVALLKGYAQALSSPNPYAYFLHTARTTMIDYFWGYGEDTQRERVPVLSLDTPCGEDGASLTDLLSTGQTLEHTTPLEEATYAFLRQAVASLPKNQRVVIERHYGFEQAPQSLNALKQVTSSKYHHRKALTTLRQALAPQFPQYAGDAK
jgi:DNA-directed RNA polymerase specialized sigma24 family protein